MNIFSLIFQIKTFYFRSNKIHEIIQRLLILTFFYLFFIFKDTIVGIIVLLQYDGKRYFVKLDEVPYE